MQLVKSQRNFWLCLALEHVWGMYFGVAVTVVFYARFGIEPTQIMILQVIMGVVTIVFDVPCGWMADHFGVRRMMLVGICLQIIQSTLFGIFCTQFWQFCIMLAITGMAWSFTSGTAKAIVMTTVPHRADDYPSRSVQARSSGQLAGIAIGSLLVLGWGARAPFAAQPLPFVAALVIGLFLVDSNSIKRRLTHPAVHSVVEISKQMLVHRPHVRWIVLLSGTANASAIAMSWLVQPDLRSAGVSVNLFGLIFAVRTIATVILAHFKNQFAKRFGNVGAQAALIALITVCGIFAGLPTGWLGAIAVLIGAATVAAFAEALMTSAINKHMPEVKTHSTTVYSISTAVQSGLFAVSPLMALVNDRVSTNAAYFFVAALTAGFGGICLHRYKHALRNLPHEEIALAV